MAEENTIPSPPKITDSELEECRRTGNYCPVLFEWYKYVGSLCNFYACIKLDSPAIRTIPAIHYYILVGLLNRCSRLMLANVALSHEGLFGETTNIIDRCITESATKVKWLTHHKKEDYFSRLLSEGLKTEIEFKAEIQAAIGERGELLQIEKRMLDSIQNHIKSSGLSESEIAASKKLPDMAAMLNSLGENRLMYIVAQRIGSHHIHGTWPSLRLHYLEDEDGVLRPRDHNCETHVNQYVFVPLLVLEAMNSFIEYICDDSSDIDAFQRLPNAIMEEIMKINLEVIGDDFELVTGI